MKIFCQNTLQGLVPVYDNDIEEKRKLKIGELYFADVKKPRNIEFHKKGFALLNLGWKNSPLDIPFDPAYRDYITMRAGFAQVYQTPEGKDIAIAESISFSNMDETRFQKYYDAILAVIRSDLGITDGELEKELAGFM